MENVTDLPTLFYRLYRITSYEELMLTLAIFNIIGYDDLTEQEFNDYYSDDWKWHLFCKAIASSEVLPF